MFPGLPFLVMFLFNEYYVEPYLTGPFGDFFVFWSFLSKSKTFEDVASFFCGFLGGCWSFLRLFEDIHKMPLVAL